MFAAFRCMSALLEAITDPVYPAPQVVGIAPLPIPQRGRVLNGLITMLSLRYIEEQATSLHHQDSVSIMQQQTASEHGADMATAREVYEAQGWTPEQLLRHVVATGALPA
jgi:hypothetical protein